VVFAEEQTAELSLRSLPELLGTELEDMRRRKFIWLVVLLKERHLRGFATLLPVAQTCHNFALNLLN
jgi:hypothetical protein